MFDLANVFEVFLPQLLMCLNPFDPLNGEAAALMMSCRAAYEQRVKDLKEIVKSCTDSSNKAVNRLLAQDTNNKSLSPKLGRRKSLLPTISEANGNTNGRSSRFSLDEKVP